MMETSPKGPSYAIMRKLEKEIILEAQLYMDENDLFKYILTNIGLYSLILYVDYRRNKGPKFHK